MQLTIGDYNLSSWSLRPWLALTVAGVSFETVSIRLDRPGSKAALLAASPTGKVPVLRDGDLVIWDSLAICEYAAERFPKASLWPTDPVARAVARAVSAEMHSGFAPLRSEHPMNLCATLPKTPSEAVSRDVARVRELWNSTRARFGADGPFLFGRFTIADAMFAPVVTRFRTYAIAPDAVCEAYGQAIEALPAMITWRNRAKAEVG